MPMIKRGDLVEFTDKAYHDYPPADTSVIRYGIAIEDSPDSAASIQVKQADGSIVSARHIHAYAWAGWIPDGLEPLMAEFQDNSDWDDEY